MDAKKCRDEARKLLRKYPNLITEPLVHVVPIARAEGFQLFKFKPQDLEERTISGFSKGNKIYINSDDVATRQVFTVAHELGHHCLGHPSDTGIHYRNAYYQKNTNVIEQEANFFAAELLMPEIFIKNALDKYNLDWEKDANQLAKLFGISKIAMHFRLKFLFS